MNQVKENSEEKVQKTGNKKSFLNMYIKPFLDGTFLSKESHEKELPFVGWVLLLVIVFISNTFWAQDTVRKITHYKIEVQELRLKSIAVKSKLMDNTRQTQVAEKVRNLGLHESMTPPKKIYYKKNERLLK
ncbi:MAG: FtsL-like putative cell division protein [Bacteroidota bacterium]|jgi:hypothetical protein